VCVLLMIVPVGHTGTGTGTGSGMVRTAVQREQRNNNDGCAAAFEEVIVRTVQ
jgi:hypothetical protein